MMSLTIINTEAAYQQALSRLEAIFDATPGTKEDEELKILGVMIDDYENTLPPIGHPDKIEAIKFRAEQEY